MRCVCTRPCSAPPAGHLLRQRGRAALLGVGLRPCADAHPPGLRAAASGPAQVGSHGLHGRVHSPPTAYLVLIIHGGDSDGCSTKEMICNPVFLHTCHLFGADRPGCKTGSQSRCSQWEPRRAASRRDRRRAGGGSRRRDCHFEDTPMFIPIETPTKGTGGVPSNDSLTDG